MKVYRYYLQLPDDFSKTLPEESRRAFYFIESGLEKLQSVKRDGYIIYFYAFTNRKALAKQFEALHNMKLFSTYHKKMSKKEYKELLKTHQYSEFKLQEIDEFSYGGQKGYMYCTGAEAYDLYGAAYDFIVNKLMDVSVYPYDMMKQKYQVSLDILRYTYYYDCVFSDDMSQWGDMESYGLTPLGYGCGEHIHPNLLTCYARIYAPLLKKGSVPLESL